MWRIVIVLVLLGLCVHTASALPGSGTQQDPYRIQSLADFDEFAADPNYWSGFTRLETDVNLTGRTYTTAVIAPDVNNAPGSTFNGTNFTGVFDGNDHKIINLTIDDGGVGNWYLGLFGYIEDDKVSNLCLEGGSVSGTGWLVGGLVGYNEGNISNCYSSGSVSGVWYVGGLVGGNHSGTLSNCYSISSVSGSVYVGGLVGDNHGSISDCYSTGDVNGVDEVGGLVGANWYRAIVSNCYSIGSVSGDDCLGGLVGLNGGSLSNCYSTGDVNGVGGLGGLVGGHRDGSISNCYSTGDVIGTKWYIGGLVGDSFFDGIISDCYANGNVSGYAYVGGLVGHNGLVDRTCLPGYIYNSYSTGSVQGVLRIGGLVGYNECGDIERSFWDVQTSGLNNSDGGIGKTTNEMQTISTFTDAGWDFIEIWGIGEHQTYPYLRFAPAGDLNYDKKVDLFDLAILAEHWLAYSF